MLVGKTIRAKYENFLFVKIANIDTEYECSYKYW